MSEVHFVVREAGHDLWGTIHGNSADRAIAAQSADPVTLAELETACARFERPSPDRPFFANRSADCTAKRLTPESSSLTSLHDW